SSCRSSGVVITRVRVRLALAERIEAQLDQQRRGSTGAAHVDVADRRERFRDDGSELGTSLILLSLRTIVQLRTQTLDHALALQPAIEGCLGVRPKAGRLLGPNAKGLAIVFFIPGAQTIFMAHVEEGLNIIYCGHCSSFIAAVEALVATPTLSGSRVGVHVGSSSRPSGWM